jgi:predicted permease
MLQLILDLVPALGLGVWLGRRLPGLSARLAPPLVSYGVPLSLTALLLRAGLRWQLLEAAVVAALAIGLGLGLLRLVAGPVPALRSGTLQLGGVVGNTAYFGIPAALALLPPEAIAYSVSYDLAATLLAWTFGPLLITGTVPGPLPLLRAVGRSPASRGLLVALVLQRTPWSAAIGAVLWWPARVVILLALVIVGLRLGAMTLEPAGAIAPAGRGLLPVLLAKLVLLPGLVWGLCLLLGLPPLLRQAVVLQGAAPTAIAVLLMAEAAGAAAAGAQVTAAAALLIWSTPVALITVPVWGWLVLNSAA